MNEEFTVTAKMLRQRPEMAKDGWKVGQKVLVAFFTRAIAVICSG
jgi:hypothetical protein